MLAQQALPLPRPASSCIRFGQRHLSNTSDGYAAYGCINLHRYMIVPFGWETGMVEMTTADLVEALRNTASRPMSAEEVRGQRASFVMGILKSENDLTKVRVRELLAAEDGVREG